MRKESVPRAPDRGSTELASIREGRGSLSWHKYDIWKPLEVPNAAAGGDTMHVTKAASGAPEHIPGRARRGSPFLRLPQPSMKSLMHPRDDVPDKLAK